MAQILRACRPDILAFCRCYGSQRNQPSHYETLQIPASSSQKEIRQAFIKRSKEIHPDMGEKGSHKEFVKVNEAYKVLSREQTRRQYDMDIRFNDIPYHAEPHIYHRPHKVVYPDHRDWTKHMPGAPPPGSINDDNYYGIKGIKRVSNVWIALLCLVVAVFGAGLQILLITKSQVFNRQALLERSAENERIYKQVRREAMKNLERDQQIEEMKKKLGLQDAGTS